MAPVDLFTALLVSLTISIGTSRAVAGPPLGFDVLFAAGTGSKAAGGPRVEWTTYAGLRKTFHVW